MSINLPFWKTEYRRWVHGMEMWLRTSAAGSGARVVMLVGEPQPHCLAAISAIAAIYQPQISQFRTSIDHQALLQFQDALIIHI
jgi:hypothetical protein